MIKVTIEFKTVDETIVALGKLVAAPGKTGQDSPARPAPAPEVAATPRRGRSDKGKQRGEYKPREPNAAPQVPQEAAGSPSAEQATIAKTAVAAPNAAPPDVGVKPPVVTSDKADAPAGAAPSKTIGEKDVEAQNALGTVLEKRNLGDALALLSRYGVKKLRDLPVDLREEFLKHAAEVAAGGEI